MNKLIILFVIILLVLCLFVVLILILNAISARTYRPTRAHIISVLRSVLEGTVKYEVWDEFICVPIRFDAKLESARQRCGELEENPEIYMDDHNVKHGCFNERGLKEIEKLLQQLCNE